MGLSSPNELILGSASNMARRLIGAAQLELGMPADALPVFQKQLRDFNAQQEQQRTPREEAELRLLYGRALVGLARAVEARSELQRSDAESEIGNRPFARPVHRHALASPLGLVQRGAIRSVQKDC